MDRIMTKGVFHPSLTYTCVYGKGDSVPIDQSASQSHNIDVMTGRPISDLTVVLRAQNKFEQEKVLSSMQEFKADYLPEDVSDDDAIKFAAPRYAQLPSELAELSERFTRQRVDELRQKQAEEMAKELAAQRQKHLEELEKDLKKESESKSESKSES